MKLTGQTKVMKFITPCLLVLCVSSVISFRSAALADGSFLLQLGTFESSDEAAKKWAEVKAGNRDIVGSLDGKISEVMLPSDPAPSYRTQAGPVATRKQARELCKQLQSRNVDCLVVETAFAATDLAPEMAGDVAPSPNVSSAPVDVTKASQPAPALAPRAANAEEQITVTDTVVVEGSPEVAVAPATTPMTEPSAAPVKPAPVAEAPAVTTSTIVPRAQSTVLASESEGNDDESYNPNDVKKPSFFRGSYRHSSNAPVSSSESKVAAAEPVKEDNKPGFFGRLFGSSSDDDKTKETQPANIKGNVEVAEAIRVPLSSSNQEQDESVSIEPVIEGAKPAPGTVIVPEKVRPASPHLYWAQMSYFSSEKVAYEFNDHLRKYLPKEMNNVRLKVTRPFGNKNKKASLRVGAFYSLDDVKSVCNEARTQGFRCTTIRDVVTDVPEIATSRAGKRKYLSPLDAVEIPAYRAPKNAIPAPEPKASVEVDGQPVSAAPSSAPVSVSDTGIGGQWVELGQYDSAQLAWNRWKELQESVPQIGKARAAITGALGGKSFQLKVGPFTTDVDAENVCKAIVKTGNNCTVATPY